MTVSTMVLRPCPKSFFTRALNSSSVIASRCVPSLTLSFWCTSRFRFWPWYPPRDSVSPFLRLRFAVDIVGYHSLEGRGAGEVFGVLQGVLHVLQPGIPVRLHGLQAELVVLEVLFEGFALVDELYDVEDLGAGKVVEGLEFRLPPQLGGHFFEGLVNGQAHALPGAGLVRAAPCAARVLDVLLPLQDIEYVVGHIAAGAPEVDLEGQGVAAGQVLQDELQGGVGHDP